MQEWHCSFHDILQVVLYYTSLFKLGLNMVMTYETTQSEGLHMEMKC